MRNAGIAAASTSGEHVHSHIHLLAIRGLLCIAKTLAAHSMHADRFLRRVSGCMRSWLAAPAEALNRIQIDALLVRMMQMLPKITCDGALSL